MSDPIQTQSTPALNGQAEPPVLEEIAEVEGGFPCGEFLSELEASDNAEPGSQAD